MIARHNNAAPQPNPAAPMGNRAVPPKGAEAPHCAGTRRIYWHTVRAGARNSVKRVAWMGYDERPEGLNGLDKGSDEGLETKGTYDETLPCMNGAGADDDARPCESEETPNTRITDCNNTYTRTITPLNVYAMEQAIINANNYSDACVEVVVASNMSSISSMNPIIIPQVNTQPGRTVLLRSSTTNAVTITRNSASGSTGTLITINSGNKLILSNIILNGGGVGSNKGGSIVKINVGGVLVMENGAKLIDNSYSPAGNSMGGAVQNLGEFIMDNSSITNCKVNPTGTNNEAKGGAVYNTGTFTMKNNSLIYTNEAKPTNTGGIAYGGGVYNSSTGIFNMISGSKIYNNQAVPTNNSATIGLGGGVYNEGTFTMTDSEVGGNATNAGNTAKKDGGGVYNTGSSASFTMQNDTGTSTIYKNTATTGSGGGVYNADGGQFTMNGGTISENTGSTGGGGVYSTGAGSDFTMNGGTIEKNTVNAGYNGGGVYNNTGSTFTMTSGDICYHPPTGVSVSPFAYGAGVYNVNVFNMHGGDIHDNKASTGGGGVYTSGTFTIDDTETTSIIDHNTAVGNGGGIQLGMTGTLTIEPYNANGVNISDNSATNGGGICSERSIDNGIVGSVVGAATGIVLINANTVFSGNIASASGWMVDADDIAKAQAVVFTHFVSSPYFFAYNNLDICYSRFVDIEPTYAHVYIKNVPAECELDEYYSTSFDGKFDGVIASLPTLSPRPAGCLPEGTTFCGWSLFPNVNVPVTTETKFKDGDNVYARIQCENPCAAYYDPVQNLCVPKKPSTSEERADDGLQALEDQIFDILKKRFRIVWGLYGTARGKGGDHGANEKT